MDIKPSSRGQSLRDLTASVARQLARGDRPAAVIEQLVQRGWPAASARQFVVNASHLSGDIRAAADERARIVAQCKRRALRGLLCTLAGLGIAAIGLSMSDVYVGLYHFAMGIVLCVFESLDFLTGLSGWWQQRHRQ